MFIQSESNFLMESCGFSCGLQFFFVVLAFRCFRVETEDGDALEHCEKSKRSNSQGV
ncbi:hypothetical protein NSE_0801 [Neorickettsia sennetsu str. Miyayama]|uniref:Uncharacterized protein n=1 Tax=Ehrlichia sennetsu (strain ATCC VR-367 / Miyayama) TaxID=222891 RepID=Q2GCX0_EHRS3|nr:hypothetical protein NSE_0801 [Neorickettsia sennetsu str. Miyayama]